MSSSGSGAIGPYDQALGIPGVSTNVAGMGLEILSRLTSQNFVTKLSKLAIPAQVNYRPSGTHSWPYWDFEMRQSWTRRGGLGTDQEKPACQPGGAIGPVAAATGWLGECLTVEYAAAGGTARDSRMAGCLTPEALPVGGVLATGYQAAGGPAGPLGLPTGAERALEDGRGRLQTFQHGSLYWTPQTGAQVVRGAILDEWGKQGFERGPAGYPVAPEIKTPSRDGAVQAFENGPYYSQATGVHRVQGLFSAKYAQLGFENSPLSFPGRRGTGAGGPGPVQPIRGRQHLLEPRCRSLGGAQRPPDADAWRETGYENGNSATPPATSSPSQTACSRTSRAASSHAARRQTEVHAL